MITYEIEVNSVIIMGKTEWVSELHRIDNEPYTSSFPLSIKTRLSVNTAEDKNVAINKAIGDAAMDMRKDD